MLLYVCSRMNNWALGSGPRYQILSHVFACCTSQKTYSDGHVRITRDSRMAVGTRFSHGHWFFDLLNVQKCVTQIIYLGPLPIGHVCFSLYTTDGSKNILKVLVLSWTRFLFTNLVELLFIHLLTYLYLMSLWMIRHI